MFGIRWKDREKKAAASRSTEQDDLNRTATSIAIKLIRGDCNALYKREMTQLFLESPGFIDDVAPQYRKALEQVLKEDGDAGR